MMDAEDTMQGETGAMDAKPGMSEDSEPVSVFLPKAALGGESVKPGDTLTLKVKDVDPETGDVEAVCDYDGEDKGMGGDTYEEGFDKAMPPEE